MKKTSSLKNQRYKKDALPADLLIAEIAGKSRAHILAHPEKFAPKNLPRSQQNTLRQMQRQLNLGMPLAYVFGHKWFLGRKFAVDKNVLIPRPETELLVEKAAAWARKNQPQIIADIGTGSGAIIISLAKELGLKNRNKTAPQAAGRGHGYFATDISPAALKVAAGNAKNLKAKIKLLAGDLAGPLEKAFAKNRFKNILITANLPYLSKKELSEPTIAKEPKLALWGGKNPCSKIEKLLQQLAQSQKKYQSLFSNSAIFLEINHNQAPAVRRAIKKHLPNAANFFIYKDLNGFPRMTTIYFN